VSDTTDTTPQEKHAWRAVDLALDLLNDWYESNEADYADDEQTNLGPTMGEIREMLEAGTPTRVVAANDTTPRMVTISEDDLSTLLDAACQHTDWLTSQGTNESQYYEDGEYEQMWDELQAARLRARAILYPEEER
jgi:hypothetical protein